MNGLRLTFPDYIVIAGYFLVVLWVGFYFKKHQSAASDYFAAGHQVPWWLAGISHYMSSFSAFSFIAYSQTAYSYGWVAITLFWVTMPACILGGLVFARRWRRARTGGWRRFPGRGWRGTACSWRFLLLSERR